MSSIENKQKELTVDHVQRIFNISSSEASRWHSVLWEGMQKVGINKTFRMAGFLATIGVESGNLQRVEENLNYSAERLLTVFPKYFKNLEQAKLYENNPKAIANRVYGGRMGNGLESTGEGYKYRGRGLIQVTGKSTYAQYQRSGVQAINDPDYLLTDAGAADSATWYWNSKGCNGFADRSNTYEMRRRVNGGLNGFDEFEALYEHALKVLSDVDEEQPVNTDPTDETQDPNNPSVAVSDKPESEEPTPDAAHSKIVEPIVGGKAQYPWNRVYQSRSGHVIEIDDTPDRERLHWYHRTGTYAEMHPDGKYVLKSVHERHDYCDKDRFHQTGGNYTSKVAGQSYEKVGKEKVLSVGSTVTIEAPSGVQVNTPRANFSNDVVAKYIQSDLFKQTGGIAQLQANRAVWAQKAGYLAPMPGSGAGSPKMGMANPHWVGTERHRYIGTHSSGDHNVGFQEDGQFLQQLTNLESQIAGQKEEVVDGQWLESSGGPRHIVSREGVYLSGVGYLIFKKLKEAEIPSLDDGECLLYLAEDGKIKVKTEEGTFPIGEL